MYGVSETKTIYLMELNIFVCFIDNLMGSRPLQAITSPVTMHYSLSDELLDERDVLAMVADMPNAIARKVARDSFLHSDYVAALDAKELVTDYVIEEIIKADLAARPPEATTATPSPVTDNTTPVTDAAATLVLNVHLLVLSLYIMFK